MYFVQNKSHFAEKVFSVSFHSLPRQDLSGSVQSQAGWSFKQPGPVEVVPANGRGTGT